MVAEQQERIRHTVAIAGIITDAQTGKAVLGARISIISSPAEFGRWVDIQRKQYGPLWEKMAERLDRKITRVDGHFHFLDLPDGPYTLQCTMPISGKRYGSNETVVNVTRDADEKIVMVTADMSLAPTSVKGRIQGPDPEDTLSDIGMAQVRVKGSGEQSFSDRMGRYLLTQIELGNRELIVTASGYEKQTQSVLLNTAGQEVIADFTLVRTS